MATTATYSEMPEWMAKGLQELWAYLKDSEKERKRMEEERKKREKEFIREQRQYKKRIQKLENLFTTQWGKLVEAIVEPGTVDLFKQRGIKVNRSMRRIEVENSKGRVIAEYDIILVNQSEVVVIEVKTTMKQWHIDEFLEKMAKFKDYCPEYKDRTIYGAVAAITYEEGIDRYAYKNGLFVLKTDRGMIKIANDENFRPREW